MQLPDEELQQLFDELETAAQLYAKAKANRFGLEEQRKIVKNELMLVAEATGEKTVSRQERFAYSHPTYRGIVAQLVSAIEKEATSEYACKLIEMRWESFRTLSANMRAART